MKVSKFLPYVLLLYFLIPYILLFRFFNLNTKFDYIEFFWAFKNSFAQALFSALLVTTLTIPMSLALFRVSAKTSSLVVKLLLLPQIMPTFFSILIAFSIWRPFPLGEVGIAFVFTLVHLGFAVILVHQATSEKLGSFGVVSQIFNFSRLSFFKNIYFPVLRNDLIVCFLMIFIFCFSSFSIPLVAGGGRDTNIEVLIFEKIFIGQQWSTAWTLSVIQNLFLTAMSVFLFRKQVSVKREFSNSIYFSSQLGLMLVFIYLATYLGGYIAGLLQAFPAIGQLSLFKDDILLATVRSLKLLLVYLGITFILLYLWLKDFVQNHKLNFASHLLSASTVLVGFSIYLFFPQSREADYFKIPLALSILYFPSLFKSFLEKTVLQLKDQVITAQIFGVSTSQIIWLILVKRIKQPLMIWYSFLTIWFLSDFATLRALGTRETTLGLIAENFLSSYRLSMAYLMSLYIILIWFFVLAVTYFLIGAGNGTYKKFKF